MSSLTPFLICYYLIFIIFPPLTCNQQLTLEVMNEEELQQLYDDEKYVITLFSKNPDCTELCKEFEDTLVSIREDLVEDSGGWVVRSYAPNIATSFGLRDSSIIFMRNGHPLLYTGSSTDDEMLLNFLTFNKESFVHNLTDATFEHETQASTGATTGDWLVMFAKRDDCPKCLKLIPIIEAVASKLKGRKNVALVERELGAVTARRFGVKEFPSFILFRLGKLYRYELPLLDVDTLANFASDGFRNAKAEPVPNPKSPFDDVTEAAADWIKENPGTFFLSIGGILLVIVILVLLNRPPPESWTKKNKKKRQ